MTSSHRGMPFWALTNDGIMVTAGSAVCVATGSTEGEGELAVVLRQAVEAIHRQERI
jgi:hypothetical protein